MAQGIQGATLVNIVFMGTPDFAATVLGRVAEWARAKSGRQLVGVYCQPDRPAGRGHKVQASAVKTLARKLDLPVFQPLNFREAADRDQLAALKPDVLVVAAYGLLLPQSVLDIPRLGPFNVHGSLLPRYRGAAPIQRCLMNGDKVTGVTIMRMEKGLDTGPMVLQRALGIGIHDTAATLYEELAQLGGRLMVEVLEGLESGAPLSLVPQDDAQASHAAKLTKADGEVDWREPAWTVHARLRGVTPRPGGRTTLRLIEADAEGGGEHWRELPVLLEPGFPGEAYADTAPAPYADVAPAPGTVLGLVNGRLAIACADAPYLVERLRPADRGLMEAAAFWNGYVRQVQRAVAHGPRPTPDTDAGV